jgi:hypothetical protein
VSGLPEDAGGTPTLPWITGETPVPPEQRTR